MHRSTQKILITLFVAAFAVGLAQAWETYGETDSCVTCHGDFRANPYVSLSDGQTWSDSLHEVHQTIVTSECDVCHSAGGRNPVFTGSSRGGFGLSPISCVGCHGRAEDGTGVGTEGYGAGLRQHHFNAGETECVTCHSDANPANKTVVGEDVLPTYYVESDPFSYPNMPTDPCSPAPDFVEDFEGTTIGIDNDGDGAYDEADSDCSTATGTPGEASFDTALLVTAHDPAAGSMTISFGPGCNATDHTLEFGPLASVSTYGYSGQDCNVGIGGSHTWTYGTGSESLFFLVVANDGNVEGSYGLDGAGAERPEDNTVATCPVPQDLSASCDP